MFCRETIGCNFAPSNFESPVCPTVPQSSVPWAGPETDRLAALLLWQTGEQEFYCRQGQV